MKNLKILFGFVVAFGLSFFIYSCAEDADISSYLNEHVVETRTSNSACSPQTLYTEYTWCTHIQKNTTISFALGLGLYSSSIKSLSDVS